MQIIIEGELPDLNTYIQAERGNRFAGAKLKKEATELVRYYTMGKKARKGQFLVNFTWYTKDLRKDADNVAFAKKFILDGLVPNCLLDDSRKYIVGLQDMFYVDKDRPRVVVDLIPYETH